MKISRALYAASTMLATGLANANEGASLIAHAHPHPGGEHLLLGLLAAAAAIGYAARRRGG